GMTVRCLPHIEALCSRGCERHDLGRNQAIEHQRIGLLEQAQRTQCQQAWITRACTHDSHLTWGQGSLAQLKFDESLVSLCVHGSCPVSVKKHPDRRLFK